MDVDILVKEEDHRPLIFKSLPTPDGSFSGFSPGLRLFFKIYIVWAISLSFHLFVSALEEGA
jgi:hypothetical protein